MNDDPMSQSDSLIVLRTRYRSVVFRLCFESNILLPVSKVNHVAFESHRPWIINLQQSPKQAEARSNNKGMPKRSKTENSRLFDGSHRKVVKLACTSLVRYWLRFTVCMYVCIYVCMYVCIYNAYVVEITVPRFITKGHILGSSMYVDLYHTRDSLPDAEPPVLLLDFKRKEQIHKTFVLKLLKLLMG